MMNDELTVEETKAIRALGRALDRLPKSLIVYVLDDQAIVCKKGVSCNDIGEVVGRGLMATNMISDIHS